MPGSVILSKKTKGFYFREIIPEGFYKFLLIVFASIIFNHYAPAVIKDLWYFLMLYLYYRSKDEPFWLIYFLVLNDGFGSFFGYRGANIDIFSFLPQFEVGHLYVLVALFKVIKSHKKMPVFYNRYLALMLFYIVFLYLYGVTQGLPADYNIHFRNLRLILPLFLIYTTPKLLSLPRNYDRVFSYIFIIEIVAFLAQVFSIVTGNSPIAFLGIVEGTVKEVTGTTIYRGFYNVSATLLSFFAAMFYLSSRNNAFNRTYLHVILIISMGAAFLSATRGWILGLGLSFILYQLIVNKISMKRIVMFTIPFIFILIVILAQPKINQQVKNAINRFMTVEAVLEGDLSAGGTASRATIQGPAVLKVWKQHPFIGWGFSDTYYDNQNAHVGNENVLLHSGILGAGILIIFFIYFHLKLIKIRGAINGDNPYGRSFLVFPIFFLALFIIHSSSGQLFGYISTYRGMFNHAVYFSFGAIVYNQAILLIRGND